MVQVGFAFRRIEMALNYIVDNLTEFSGLAAQSERLDTLFSGVHFCTNTRSRHGVHAYMYVRMSSLWDDRAVIAVHDMNNGHMTIVRTTRNAVARQHQTE